MQSQRAHAAFLFIVLVGVLLAAADHTRAQTLPPCSFLSVTDADTCGTFCSGRNTPQHLFGNDDVCSCGADDVFVSVCTTAPESLERQDVGAFYDTNNVQIPICSAVGITSEEECGRVCSSTTWNTRTLYFIEQSVWSCVCDARNTSFAVCGDVTYSTNSVFVDEDDDTFFQVIPETDVLRQELLEGSEPQCAGITENVVTNQLVDCFQTLLADKAQAIDPSADLTEDDLDRTCQDRCLTQLLRAAVALNQTDCLDAGDPFTTSLRGLLGDVPSLTFLCQTDNDRYCHLLNPTLQRLANTDGQPEDCQQVVDYGACFGTILEGTSAGYLFGQIPSAAEIDLVRTHIIDYCASMGVNVTTAATSTAAPVNLLATSGAAQAASMHAWTLWSILLACVACFFTLPSSS